MGWEIRNGRPHYYQKKRSGRKVISQYVGSGEVAHLISQLDALHAEEEACKRSLELAERARQDEMDARIDEVGTIIETLTQGALLASGYHMHRRQWRRQR